MVLCDREFDSMRVFQTLSNLDVNYLIPKRITNSEREVIERMDEDDQEVAVETASVHVEAGSHPMRFLYVPSTVVKGRIAPRRGYRAAGSPSQPHYPCRSRRSTADGSRKDKRFETRLKMTLHSSTTSN